MHWRHVAPALIPLEFRGLAYVKVVFWPESKIVIHFPIVAYSPLEGLHALGTTSVASDLTAISKTGDMESKPAFPYPVTPVSLRWVAALPCPWCYRLSAWTGRPVVSILWLHETAGHWSGLQLLSMTASTVIKPIYLTLRYTLRVADNFTGWLGVKH